ELDMDRRHCPAQGSDKRRQQQRGGQQSMACCGGSARQAGGRDKGDCEDDGHANRGVEKEHHRDPLLVFLINSTIRSSSSSVTRLPSPPSSAATTLAFEPSKNVSTRCFNAERRAEGRGTAGSETTRSACYS